MSLYCEIDELHNESDVEQKFIYQLLTFPSPMGMGYKSSDILTKHILRQYLIGKGQQKYYYPDYLVTLRGIPLMVIEAKSPNEDLSKAYSEARLYSSEINAQFPHNINICSRIVVSNGIETWAGFSDQGDPIYVLPLSSISTEHKEYVDFINFCSKAKLSEFANFPYIRSRGNTYFVSPISALGGSRVQDEELVENTYGRTLIFENRHIFDPDSENERVDIVKNAYITSTKREQHAEPLYKEIKKLQLPSEVNSTLVSTDNPIEFVDSLNINVNNFSYSSLILLIGIVGSGKSTFVRYFKEIILKDRYPDLYEKCEWIFINMNAAPVNRNEIFSWIKSSLIDSIEKNHYTVDFKELELLKRIFSAEIKEFEKGIGLIIKNDVDKYNHELFLLLKGVIGDNEKKLKAYIHFLKTNFHRIPIIVLDNCDKRDKEEQLLLFEVAQWIRDNYKCIVILPMRDSTYDLYKNEPPLDTVVKDLVFRIDASDLLKILQARLEYIYRLNKSKSDFYVLDNNMKVLVKREEQIEYFSCILMAIRKNSWAMHIFYKLTNKNIRTGIQLFEDMCKSGHIKSEEIFKIRTANDFDISNRSVMNALLRKNRKYFSDLKSNFTNVFYADYNDDFPDPFIRVDILLWLKTRLLRKGNIDIKGYHKISQMVCDLQNAGHNENIILRELKNLISRGLIFSEAITFDIADDDLVKISPAGTLHLYLLSNISYLAACAEDTIYKNSQTMMQISRRIASSAYLQRIQQVATVKNMIDYLVEYRTEFISRPEVYVKDNEYTKIYDLSECFDLITKMSEQDKQIDRVLRLISNYKPDLVVECRVVYKHTNSILCVFDNDIRGFLAENIEQCNLDQQKLNDLKINDMITCRVIDFDIPHDSFHLRFLNKIIIDDEHSVNIP